MKKIIIILLSFFVSLNIFAQYEDEDDSEVSSKPFYFQFGLGIAPNYYSDEVINDALNDPTDDYVRTPFFLDLSGYAAIAPNILVGGSITASIDRLTYKEDNDYYYDFETWLFGVSAMLFLDEIGSGPFIRGDLGYTYTSVSDESGETIFESTNESGTGFNVIAGYAVRTGRYSYLPAFIFSQKIVGISNVSTFGFTLSVLF